MTRQAAAFGRRAPTAVAHHDRRGETTSLVEVRDFGERRRRVGPASVAAFFQRLLVGYEPPPRPAESGEIIKINRSPAAFDLARDETRRAQRPGQTRFAAGVQVHTRRRVHNHRHRPAGRPRRFKGRDRPKDEP